MAYFILFYLVAVLQNKEIPIVAFTTINTFCTICTKYQIGDQPASCSRTQVQSAVNTIQVTSTSHASIGSPEPAFARTGTRRVELEAVASNCNNVTNTQMRIRSCCILVTAKWLMVESIVFVQQHNITPSEHKRTCWRSFLCSIVRPQQNALLIAQTIFAIQE